MLRCSPILPDVCSPIGEYIEDPRLLSQNYSFSFLRKVESRFVWFDVDVSLPVQMQHEVLSRCPGCLVFEQVLDRHSSEIDCGNCHSWDICEFCFHDVAWTGTPASMPIASLFL